MLPSLTGRVTAASVRLLAGDLRKVGVLVGAQQDFAARCDVLVLGCGRCLDALYDEAAFIGCGVAALLLDFAEEFPRLVGDRVGEVFDVVRTAGRIDDLIEVRLVFEQQFDVAGDAHRKFVGIFVCLVERSHLERVYAGDRCRHRFGRAAQHIDVGSYAVWFHVEVTACVNILQGQFFAGL